jgi:hypothetical protein
VTARAYPSNPAEAGFALFLRWFGKHYARSTAVTEESAGDAILRARVSVGRRWELSATVVNTLAPEATLPWEAARAALEQRLDGAGHSVALWVPPGAPLPSEEPGLSEMVAAIEGASPIADERLEVRRPVRLHLRRTSTTGSVVTVLGGLSAHWAQFTNRVPGSFQLNSTALYRLPASAEERAQLAERIVMAAGQPDVDDTQVIPAEDVWSANDPGEGRSYVIGTPQPPNDDQSASLRRNLRQLLRDARGAVAAPRDASEALVVLGAATYAEEEKLTWTLRGMDPSLYAGYDIIAVVADGVVKPLLQPQRQTLPWDAPLS